MRPQEELKQILIEKVKKTEWWHVPPQDPNSYLKRGLFLSSRFDDAMFYGRPYDFNYGVCILNPIFGFSEDEIWKQLFPDNHQEILDLFPEHGESKWYAVRTYVDAMKAYTAQAMGYDSIVQMREDGKTALFNNRKPYFIELCLLYPHKILKPRYEEPDLFDRW